MSRILEKNNQLGIKTSEKTSHSNYLHPVFPEPQKRQGTRIRASNRPALGGRAGVAREGRVRPLVRCSREYRTSAVRQ